MQRKRGLNGSSLHLQHLTKMVALNQWLKVYKRAIKKAIGDNKLTPFELYTCFLEIANLINQHPIGRVTTDPNEGTYLCPNDILLGRASSEIPKGHLKRLETRENALSLYREYWMISGNTGKVTSSQRWFLVESGMQIEEMLVSMMLLLLKTRMLLQEIGQLGKL